MPDIEGLLAQKNRAIHEAGVKRAEAAKLSEDAAELELRLFELRKDRDGAAVAVVNLLSAGALFSDAGRFDRGIEVLGQALQAANGNERLCAEITREITYRRRILEAKFERGADQANEPQ